MDRDDNSPYARAQRELHLTPQEKSLYERHLMNLNTPGGVDNPDGTRSSILMTPREVAGRHYALPAIYEGRDIGPENVLARAREQGLDTFPSYGSNEELKARYDQLHGYMEEDTTNREQRGLDEMMTGTGETYRAGGVVRQETPPDRNVLREPWGVPEDPKGLLLHRDPWRGEEQDKEEWHRADPVNPMLSSPNLPQAHYAQGGMVTKHGSATVVPCKNKFGG